MMDKSWELLTKLLTAYGCDITEIYKNKSSTSSTKRKENK